MRKNRLLWAKLLFVLAGFSTLVSCTEIDSNIQGPTTYVIEVRQDQWLWDRVSGRYFFVVSPAPSWMSENIANKGIVMAYIDDFNPTTNLYTYLPLPYSFDYHNAGSGWYRETISYEFDVNYLGFIASASDAFNNGTSLPRAYKFQVRMVY